MPSIKLNNVSVWYSLRGKLNLTASGVGHEANKAKDVGVRIFSSIENQAMSKPLDNISLSIAAGQSVGLVGHNGAGKTTLLRVLAGALCPQEGTVEVEGKRTSLLSVGGAINPNLSGYENVIQRGLWLGRSLNEIKDKLVDIAEFTELGPYLHADVSIYSAGMRARLMFATVTAFEPEILILDEGIVVGDANFQARARGRMNIFTQKASIMVLASHSTRLLRDTCEYGLWMHRGKNQMFGPLEDVLKAYYKTVTN